MKLLRASLADAIRDEIAEETERAEDLPSFRAFLESPEYAAPYMAAVGISPVVAAIVDASEGSPVETLDEAGCREVFRCAPDELPLGEVPRIVVVNAGRQGGKTSNLLAPKAVHAAWTQPAPFLRPGQVARVVIISPKSDQSKAAFRYCKGIVESSPRISRNIVKVTTEQILIRRPDGHFVEIVTGAADSGGTAARSATLLFAGLDEVAFFYADDGHSVNDRAIFDAAMGTLRMLPGAQLWMVSTPWIEGSGLMEEFIADHWGTRSSVLVAARVSSYALRGKADDGSLREETDTEETYRREVLSQPMPAGASGFFSAAELTRAIDRKPPEGAPLELGAGGDFAFERDAAAAVVVGRWIGGFFAAMLVRERRATPGDIEAATQTIRELGADVAEAGCSQIMGDHWKRTFAREHLHLEGVAFVDAPGGDEGKAETYGAMKRVVAEGRLCLGLLTRHEAEYVRDQLRSVVATPMPGPGGRFRISAPRTKRLLEGAGAGRIGSHADVASALVTACWQAGSGRQAASWERPVHTSPARETRQAAMRQRVGAAGSMDYLRERSVYGRPALGRGED